MSDIVDIRVATADQMDLRGDTILVMVQEQHFYVHRDLITARSRHSKAILDDGDPTDPEKDDVILELQSPNTFEVYIHYLYSGKIPCRGDNLHSSKSDYRPLVELYLLAEHLQDVDAMDATADAILALYHDISTEAQSIPPGKSIELVLAKSEPWSMLRKLFLGILSWKGEEDIFDYTPPADGVNGDDGDSNVVSGDEEIWASEEAPQSIVCNVWRRLLALNKAVRAGKASLTTLATAKTCDYHEHGPNRECRSLKRKRENGESEVADGLPRCDRCKIRRLKAELEQAKGEVERLRSAVPGAPSARGRSRS